MYYMTQKNYRSKTFTDFTHSMSEIISGMCSNGIVVTGLQEWTVTEHMDGTPMYIAPENRLRIW